MKRLLITLCVAACLGGCVETNTTEPEGQHYTRLSHVQSDGEMTMSWESRLGYTYRVYVKDERHFWIWEKRFPDMPGTGETMKLTRKFRPGTELPLYAVRGIKDSLLKK